MHSYQIIAGFSEIKSELRNYYKMSNPLNELHLWFTFEDNVLCAHDFNEHAKFLALAAHDQFAGDWNTTFRGGDYGTQLIEYAIETFEMHKLAKEFYGFYLLNGHFTFR